ncbi:MAG TPA: hypothetical protein VM537_27090 [Anaerolineae bacterium]|nr:hypothetical protein [Anaerolineae bacterium]
MQIAFLVEGRQTKANGEYVQHYARVDFPPSDWFRAVKDVRHVTHTGHLDPRRGHRLEDIAAEPWVNPDASIEELPSPGYCWFTSFQPAMAWLRAHGYHALDELTVSIPEA